jgi:hypothetical protein
LVVHLETTNSIGTGITLTLVFITEFVKLKWLNYDT